MTRNGDGLSLSTRLNRLFDLVRPLNAPEHTNAQVAAAASISLGYTVHTSSIEHLRDGIDPGNDILVLSAVAKHFSIPGYYLCGSATEYMQFDIQLQNLIATREAGVKFVALRSHSDRLSAAAVDELSALICSVTTDNAQHDAT
jgi:hypothetical protein